MPATATIVAVEGKVPVVTAVVLAAGAGSRFGGDKLTAKVDGKAVLQHVLDTLAEAGIADPVVVLGAPLHAGIEWGAARPVTNPDPSRGLSSSLSVGWEAALAGEPRPDAILVALGDQPLLRADAVRLITSQPFDAVRPVVAAEHGAGGPPNPVRLESSASGLIAETVGDRGLGPVLAAHPELVCWIAVDGDNPDVDTPADLARVAELAWADRVRRNREQVDRFREAPDGRDFYASVSSIFRDDPDRTGDPVLDALRAHARPGDTWLDIGAGAGRYALPLARSVRNVIALDPSAGMLGSLHEAMVGHGITNVRVVEGRWPEAVTDPTGDGLAGELPVDVALIAHVGYDVDAIGPFVDAMEGAANRECLAVLMERSPAMLAEPFWPPLHGEPRIALPALPAFVDLLRARGRVPRVDMLESSRRRWGSRDEIEAYVRRQTWVAPGTAKDRRLQALIDDWLVTNDDGSVELSVVEPLQVGLVAWDPAD